MDKKQAIGEAREMLDAMGQKNEKQAAKWVIYFNRLKEKQADWEEDQRKGKLQKNRRTKREYFREMVKIINQILKDLERPTSGYVVGAGYDSKGVYVELWDKYKRTFKRAIKPCGDPKIDLKAVWVLIGSTDDTMWHIESQKQTTSGIYLN